MPSALLKETSSVSSCVSAPNSLGSEPRSRPPRQRKSSFFRFEIPAGIALILKWDSNVERLQLRECQKRLREATQADRRVAVVTKRPTEAELLEAASELAKGSTSLMETPFGMSKDMDRAQISSGDDMSPQRRPERRPQELFKAPEDRDVVHVRSDGSDELSKVCCVEVAEGRAVSLLEVQPAHRLGVRASPGDDPGGA